jgi:hypothetical protein
MRRGGRPGREREKSFSRGGACPIVRGPSIQTMPAKCALRSRVAAFDQTRLKFATSASSISGGHRVTSCCDREDRRASRCRCRREWPFDSYALYFVVTTTLTQAAMWRLKIPPVFHKNIVDRDDVLSISYPRDHSRITQTTKPNLTSDCWASNQTNQSQCRQWID